MEGVLERGFSRRTNFWVGVIVLAALVVGAFAIVRFFLR
jgi:hypothetical protein